MAWGVFGHSMWATSHDFPCGVAPVGQFGINAVLQIMSWFNFLPCLNLDEGMTQILKIAAPVNPCTSGTDPCNPDGSSLHTCVNAGGGDYTCTCGSGYEPTSDARTACTGK